MCVCEGREKGRERERGGCVYTCLPLFTHVPVPATCQHQLLVLSRISVLPTIIIMMTQTAARLRKIGLNLKLQPDSFSSSYFLSSSSFNPITCTVHSKFVSCNNANR